MNSNETTSILTKLIGAFPSMTEEQQSLALKAMLPYPLPVAREAADAVALDGKWFAASDFATALRKAAGERVKSPASEAAERQRREYAAYRAGLETDLEASMQSRNAFLEQFASYPEQDQAELIRLAVEDTVKDERQRRKWMEKDIVASRGLSAMVQAYHAKVTRQGGVL